MNAALDWKTNMDTLGDREFGPEADPRIYLNQKNKGWEVSHLLFSFEALGAKNVLPVTKGSTTMITFLNIFLILPRSLKNSDISFTTLCPLPKLEKRKKNIVGIFMQHVP